MMEGLPLVATATEVVGAPLSCYNLAEWLFSLTDDEFQDCATEHVAAAINRLPDGRRQFIAVESFGDVLFVQRFAAEVAAKSHCRLHSTSEVFLKSGTTRLNVIWDIATKAMSTTSCELINTLVIHVTPELEAMLLDAGHRPGAVLSDLQMAADRHLAAETIRFARDLEAKLVGAANPRSVLPDRGADGAVLADSRCKAVVEAPIAAIDLPNWLFGLSEADYRACSVAHITAGAGAAADGKRLSINVEQPGSLLIQHYREVVSERTHCVVISSRSDMFAEGGRNTLHISWELSLVPLDDARTELTNHVVVRTTPEFAAFLERAGISLDAARAAREPIVAAHTAEETPHFAADMTKKALAGLKERDSTLGWEDIRKPQYD